MKTLSVIIPIYNTPEEYFSRCLASLQCAHAHEVEIIAVDDGSKPEFSAKIQKLIDSSPLDINIIKRKTADKTQPGNMALNVQMDSISSLWMRMIMSIRLYWIKSLLY